MSSRRRPSLGGERQETPSARNDRLIAVPVADPKVADGCEDVGDLPERLRDEMEQFFLSTTFFTHKRATVRGWKGHKAAAKLVRRSQTV